MNQFVVRVYNVNELGDFLGGYSLDLSTSRPDKDPDMQLPEPVYEYTLDKSNKYFQIDSHKIRLQ